MSYKKVDRVRRDRDKNHNDLKKKPSQTSHSKSPNLRIAKAHTQRKNHQNDLKKKPSQTSHSKSPNLRIAKAHTQRKNYQSINQDWKNDPFKILKKFIQDLGLEALEHPRNINGQLKNSDAPGNFLAISDILG